jgi:hypothetical protein
LCIFNLNKEELLKAKPDLILAHESQKATANKVLSSLEKQALTYTTLMPCFSNDDNTLFAVAFCDSCARIRSGLYIVGVSTVDDYPKDVKKGKKQFDALNLNKEELLINIHYFDALFL